MEILVRVVPNARKPSISEEGKNIYKARVDAPAEGGRANARLVEMLAEHFGTSRSNVEIVRGLMSRRKVVRIEA